MSGKRILFIDGDEPFIRDIADAVEQQGYQVVLTGSSVDGVELARTERPDLIVVSVELQPAAGWSVCTRLKKDDDLKDIPLILTSSHAPLDTFEKHKKLKTRADEYLLKPYSVDELLRLAGPLLGLAETVSEDDLIAEDESLTDGAYDSAIEEEIQVPSDEPLANGHDESELALDPLAGNGDSLLDDDSLGDLGGDDLEAPRPAMPADESGDDLDAFEQSFDQLASGDDSPAAAPAEAAPELELSTEGLGDEIGSTPSETDGANGETFGDFADSLNLETATEGEAVAAPAEEAFETPQLDALSEEPAVAEESLEAATEEPAFAAEAAVAEDLSFEEPAAEAPAVEEAPAEQFSAEEIDLSEPVAEAAPEPAAPIVDTARVTELESTVASLEAEIQALRARPPPPPPPAPVAVSAANSSRVAELEATVASLEAELDGFRATEGSHHEEVERLRGESGRKEDEINKLHDQVRDRDRQIRELKDADSRASVEAAKARDERLRREAQIKSLTQRTEQMSATSQKLERDLAAALEEASAVAPLKSRVADLEEQLKAAQIVVGEVKSLKDEIEKGRRDLDRVRAAHGQAVIDLESHRTDLEAARIELEEARRIGTEQTSLAKDLQARLNEVEDKMKNFAAQAQAHGDRAGRARAQLLALAEELGLKQ